MTIAHQISNVSPEQNDFPQLVHFSRYSRPEEIYPAGQPAAIESEIMIPLQIFPIGEFSHPLSGDVENLQIETPGLRKPHNHRYRRIERIGINGGDGEFSGNPDYALGG